MTPAQTAILDPALASHDQEIVANDPAGASGRWFKNKKSQRRLWWAKGGFTTLMLIAWAVSGWTLGRRRLVLNAFVLAVLFGITPWFVLWLARVALTWPMYRGHHKNVELTMMVITGLVSLLSLSFFITMCSSSGFRG